MSKLIEPPRYSPLNPYESVMEESPYGDWVRYEDFLKLRERVLQLSQVVVEHVL